MPSSVVRRVKNYRDKLHAAGLRPVQIWVPDTRRPGFAEECRRQSLLVRDSPTERAVHEWMDATMDTEGWK